MGRRTEKRETESEPQGGPNRPTRPFLISYRGESMAMAHGCARNRVIVRQANMGQGAACMQAHQNVPRRLVRGPALSSFQSAFLLLFAFSPLRQSNKAKKKTSNINNNNRNPPTRFDCRRNAPLSSPIPERQKAAPSLCGNGGISARMSGPWHHSVLLTERRNCTMHGSCDRRGQSM